MLMVRMMLGGSRGAEAFGAGIGAEGGGGVVTHIALQFSRAVGTVATAVHPPTFQVASAARLRGWPGLRNRFTLICWSAWPPLLDHPPRVTLDR